MNTMDTLEKKVSNYMKPWFDVLLKYNKFFDSIFYIIRFDFDVNRF